MNTPYRVTVAIEYMPQDGPDDAEPLVFSAQAECESEAVEDLREVIDQVCTGVLVTAGFAVVQDEDEDGTEPDAEAET